jgi:hypothetical protein
MYMPSFPEAPTMQTLIEYVPVESTAAASLATHVTEIVP